MQKFKHLTQQIKQLKQLFKQQIKQLKQQFRQYLNSLSSVSKNINKL